MSRRRRYAIVGTGSRAGMFVDAIAGTYRETAELVGLSDLSQTRMDWHNGRLATVAGATSLPTYLADRFDRMVADTHPTPSSSPRWMPLTTGTSRGPWSSAAT